MRIYFTEQNKKEYEKCVEEIIESNQWTEGKYTEEFERLFEKDVQMHSVAVTNCGAALYLLFKYANVRGKEVIIPGNTFYATVAAARLAGAKVVYADCNREDLCLCYEDLVSKVTSNTAAVVVVHMAGHIAFEIEKIAEYCKNRNIYLIEDCAHAYGAEWKGKKAGAWGLGGAYSFYATKTISTGEGGMVVSKNKQFIEWCKAERNYGKKNINGKIIYTQLDAFNFRISEFTAAIGCIQMRNAGVILERKRRMAQKLDEIFENRVKLPKGMLSGYYKYVVFDERVKVETGRVYSRYDQCYVVYGDGSVLPNCEWIGENHKCVPIYCGWEHEEKNVEELTKILINEEK